MANYNMLGDDTNDFADPALQYQEEVSLLKAMFEEWDEATLVRVIASNNGNAEASIDTILAAGSASQFNAQQNPDPVTQQQQRQQQQNLQQLQQGQQRVVLQSSLPPQQQQQDMVMVTAPTGSTTGSTLSIMHNGTSFHVQVPPGVNPGGQFIANVPRAVAPTLANNNIDPQYAFRQQQQRQMQQLELQQQQQQEASVPPQPTGRGKAVALPPKFLRPPGWTAAPEETGGQEMTDEQLAILLQDEMFLQELASHPEFQQQFQQQSPQQQQQPSVPSTTTSTNRSGGGLFSRGRNSNTTAAGGETPAAAATSSSWSLAMKNRLKSMGANFNRRQRTSEGYGTVGDSETNEESPFHWADDNVEDSNEMITFSPSPRGMTMDKPQPHPSQAREPSQERDEEPPTITGEELIASSLGEDVPPPKELLRQPSGDDTPFIDVDFMGESVEMTTPQPKNVGGLNGNNEVYDV